MPLRIIVICVCVAVQAGFLWGHYLCWRDERKWRRSPTTPVLRTRAGGKEVWIESADGAVVFAKYALSDITFVKEVTV